MREPEDPRFTPEEIEAERGDTHLAVLREFRERGVGASLVREAERRAKEIGARALVF